MIVPIPHSCETRRRAARPHPRRRTAPPKNFERSCPRSVETGGDRGSICIGDPHHPCVPPAPLLTASSGGRAIFLFVTAVAFVELIGIWPTPSAFGLSRRITILASVASPRRRPGGAIVGPPPASPPRPAAFSLYSLFNSIRPRRRASRCCRRPRPIIMDVIIRALHWLIRDRAVEVKIGGAPASLIRDRQSRCRRPSKVTTRARRPAAPTSTAAPTHRPQGPRQTSPHRKGSDRAG